MRKYIALGTVLVLGVSAQAAMAAEGLSYKYLEAGYASSELSVDGVPGSLDMSGFSLDGSVAIGESFYGFFNYSDTSKSGFHLKPLSLGLGFRVPVGTSVDFVSGLSYESIKVTGASSESGWGAGIGLRGTVGMVELNGGVKYVGYGDGANPWVFGVGARYNFTEALSAGVEYEKWTDLDPLNVSQWGVGLRYSF